MHVAWLALSAIGAAAFLSSFAALPIAFIPGLIASSVIGLMLLGGVLGLLPQTAVVLAVLGIVLLPVGLFRHRRHRRDGIPRRGLAALGLLAVLALAVYMAFVLQGKRLTGYDSFTHWGLIIKQMVLTDRLSNQTDFLQFQSYPPGAALFAYFVLQFLPFSDGNMMLAQLWLMLSFLCALLALVPDARGADRKSLLTGHLPLLLLTLLAMLILLCGITRFTQDIAVDTLLVTAAVACFAALLYFRENARWQALVYIPLSVALILIKHSGLFFVIAHAVLLVWLSRRQRILSVKTALCVIVPLCFLLLWHWYTATHYDAADLSKHSVSLAYYRQILGEKGSFSPWALFQAYARASSPLTNRYTGSFLVAAVLLTAGCLIARRRGVLRPLPCRLLIGIGLFFLAYWIGIYGMYVFSMPAEEAGRLAEMNRYLATGYLYAFGAVVATGLCFYEDKMRLLSLAILTGVVLLSFRPQQIRDAFRFADADARVAAIDRAIGDVDHLPSAVVYSPPAASDDGYTYYYMQYRLYTDGLFFITSPADGHEQALLDLIRLHGELIVVDEDPFIERFRAMYYPSP